MKFERLDNYIKILSGFPFKSELFNEEGIGQPLIRVRDVNSGFSGMYYSGKYPYEYVINNGDILVGMDGDFKVVVWKRGTALLNQRVCKLVVDEKKLNKFYLLQYLPKALINIHKKTTFTTVKHLSSKSIGAIQIPIPPLDDQIRIAAVLTRAEKLIAKRKESIEALDELLKSTFLEMFGDPTRPKCTNIVKTLEEICNFKGGGTPSKAKPEYFTGNIPWVSPKDMKSLYIYTSIDKITNEAIMNSSTSLIPKGSVLMVVRSGILKNKLPVAINAVDVAINQDMKAFTSKVVVASYLLYFFISNEKVMLKKVRGTTADNFNFDDIKKMKIIIPPLPLQNQFAAIVEKVESLKAKYTQSLTDLENLYGSLSQQAFKGSLDLSKVSVEKEKRAIELQEERMAAASMTGELSASKNIM